MAPEQRKLQEVAGEGEGFPKGGGVMPCVITTSSNQKYTLDIFLDLFKQYLG